MVSFAVTITAVHPRSWQRCTRPTRARQRRNGDDPGHARPRDLLRQEFGADSVPILAPTERRQPHRTAVLPSSLGRGGLLGRRAHQRRRGGAPERILGRSSSVCRRTGRIDARAVDRDLQRIDEHAITAQRCCPLKSHGTGTVYTAGNGGAGVEARRLGMRSRRRCPLGNAAAAIGIQSR